MRDDHTLPPVWNGSNQLIEFLELCERTEGTQQGFYDPDSGFIVQVKLDKGRVAAWMISSPFSAEQVQTAGFELSADKLYSVGHGKPIVIN